VLIIEEEEDAFWVFTVIVENHLPGNERAASACVGLGASPLPPAHLSCAAIHSLLPLLRKLDRLLSSKSDRNRGGPEGVRRSPTAAATEAAGQVRRALIPGRVCDHEVVHGSVCAFWPADRDVDVPVGSLHFLW
jgi:hypothetical protein